MPTWTWYGEPVFRYRDELGRFASSRDVWAWANTSIDNSAGAMGELAARVADQSISLGEWQTEMRERIKRETIRQYLAGRGGSERMTPQDNGSIGGMLADQYRYLDDFAERIANGEHSEKQIAAISRMYINSAHEAYERAAARTRGLPEMPAYPGDGQTRCLCIISLESRVLTERAGWLPLADVCVGDRVMTHRRRWKRVTALIAKPSQPECTYAQLITPEGKKVQFTTEHLWYTPNGWHNSNDIDSLSLPMYHTPVYQKGGENDKERLQDLRGAFVEPKQAEPVHVMSVGMCLRKAQRLPSESMFQLFSKPQSDKTVRVDLPDLREAIQTIPAWEERHAEILFRGVLSEGTAIFDLVVEEDHSFVVEGFVAHNTNCRCNWHHVHRTGRWESTWTLSPVENCVDCLDNAATWNPLVTLDEDLPRID